VVPLDLSQSGEGRSRRAAEQDAARRVLDELKSRDRPGSGLRD
jgi:ribonuclease-3